LEVWQKVLIAGDGAAEFKASKHGQLACTECHHGRDGNLTKDEAHTGLVARPSADPQEFCAACHSLDVQRHKGSLHANLWGEKNLVAARHGVADFADLPAGVLAGYDRNCGSCHASCGDCHVGRPASVGGGFVAGHRFGTPDMTENCTACHGSRVGAEYRGENTGIPADAHYLPGGMRCESCHGMMEMHGAGAKVKNRLAAQYQSTCEGCHAEASANAYHLQHWDDLSCQVCHSQDYKSCNSCHAGTGLAEPSYMSFKIGRNPAPDKRPGAFVTLRHIPIAPDTYEAWGTAELPAYAAAPTWRYAAPHNIRRWTSRTEVPEGGTCSTNCHESSDGPEGVFLRQSDLDSMSPAEAEANRDLIVPDGSPVNW
jgi:thiosulfate/3-mercaptopyruvate sulfurtransferase